MHIWSILRLYIMDNNFPLTRGLTIRAAGFAVRFDWCHGDGGCGTCRRSAGIFEHRLGGGCGCPTGRCAQQASCKQKNSTLVSVHNQNWYTCMSGTPTHSSRWQFPHCRDPLDTSPRSRTRSESRIRMSIERQSGQPPSLHPVKFAASRHQTVDRLPRWLYNRVYPF